VLSQLLKLLVTKKVKSLQKKWLLKSLWKKKQWSIKKPDIQAALDDLIATEVALQEAKKSDILEREESKKAINDYTRNVLLQTWTKEKIESFNIDEAAIKEAYDERVANLASKEFNARHILVKTEDEAKAIITEVNAEEVGLKQLQWFQHSQMQLRKWLRAIFQKSQ